MRSFRPASRAWGAASLIGAVLFCGGCAEELGPVPMRVAGVRGAVREGDRPLRGGWIEFIPADGTVGNLRSIRIRPDGTFDAEGVAVGTNAIRLVDAPVESPAHGALLVRLGWAGMVRQGDRSREPAPQARLLMRYDTPIRRVIGPDPSSALDIDVVEEARRFQEEWERKKAGPAASTGEGP